MLPDYEFELCLTHDVDRVYKTYQTPYYALKERDPSHIFSALRGENPYWQFEDLVALEEDLGVRSAFYFLNEQRLFRDRHPREWVNPGSWKRYAGRYDVTDPDIVDVIHRLDAGGWEVGLHGSFDSYRDHDRLRDEKETLESVLGHEVRGGRQHYLNLDVPTTWEYHRDIGLDYDASLGSRSTYGFQHGYDVHRPFDDEFVVFPLTIMEVGPMEAASSVEGAWRECERVLEEAAANDAVMTVLWHPRLFNEEEFPGYRELYRRTVERAQELDAWVGPPGELYETLERRVRQ